MIPKEFQLSLDKWCARLPEDHRVNKELRAIRKRIGELEETIVDKALDKSVAGTCQLCSGGYHGLLRKLTALEASSAHLIDDLARLRRERDELRRLLNRAAQDSIGLFIEYRDVHGYDEKTAKDKAMAEVEEGIEATAELSEYDAKQERDELREALDDILTDYITYSDFSEDLADAAKQALGRGE